MTQLKSAATGTGYPLKGIPAAPSGQSGVPSGVEKVLGSGISVVEGKPVRDTDSRFAFAMAGSKGGKGGFGRQAGEV